MLRNYNNINDNIKNNYKLAREKHTIEYSKYLNNKYNNFNIKMNILTALNLLNNFTDLSDPDVSLPNLEHLYQSAHAAYLANEPDWMIVSCLIHDLGKILYIKGCNEDGTSKDSQYSIVGDTFILGCKIPDDIILNEYNILNSDMNNNLYNTKYGIYDKNCGLDNCIISYGHDEYLYQLLKFNKHKLPDKALYLIRYHSLYLHHTNNSYKHLLNDNDKILLPLLKKFNSYDLYSKETAIITNEQKTYYNNLLIQFFPSDIYF